MRGGQPRPAGCSLRADRVLRRGVVPRRGVLGWGIRGTVRGRGVFSRDTPGWGAVGGRGAVRGGGTARGGGAARARGTVRSRGAARGGGAVRGRGTAGGGGA